MRHVEVRRGAYADSVTLLRVSREVADAPGVRTAQVAMATPLNLEVLEGMGFEPPDVTPNDMLVAVELEPGTDLATALAAVDHALAAREPASVGGALGAVGVPPRTTASALRALSGGPAAGSALALVSVPGAAAALEAVDALDGGCDVMVFSDNVPVDQEVSLKRYAEERGLLVMGPDCGTALVGGTALGFCNDVPGGRVGIVAASGTGCQQLLCLLAAAGVGVGAALGVGGRDLSAAVGGASTRRALARLDEDPDIDLVVVLSKPPDPDVAAGLEAVAAGLATPVVFAPLGPGRPDLTRTAEAVLEQLDRSVPAWPTWGATAGRAAGPWLRGLFVGGTLCDEAAVVAGEALGPVLSNVAKDPGLRLDRSLHAQGHSVVDFGDDELTRGRAHPMIDPTLRLEHLARAAADPGTGVLLLDVVLGHGAEPDPAALLAPAIRGAVATAGREGRDLPVLVACIGTDDDPQGLTRQAEAIADAGAEVHLSNAAAVRRAVELLAAGGAS